MIEKQLNEQPDSGKDAELNITLAELKQEFKELATDVVPPKVEELRLFRTNLLEAIVTGDPLWKDFQQNILGKKMNLASYRAREKQVETNLKDQLEYAIGLREGFNQYCKTTLQQIERQRSYLGNDLFKITKDPALKEKLLNEVRTLEEIEGRLQIINADWNAVYEYIKGMIEDKRNEHEFEILENDRYFNDYPGSKKDSTYQDHLKEKANAKIYAESGTRRSRMNAAKYGGSFNPENCTNTKGSRAGEKATLDNYYKNIEESSKKGRDVQNRNETIVLEVPDPYEVLKYIINDINKSKDSTKLLGITTERLEK